MDIVGSIASIITLCQIAGNGVELAKTLYRAPEELAALQVGQASRCGPLVHQLGSKSPRLTAIGLWKEQLQEFRDLVQRADSLHVHTDSTVVHNALSKAQGTLDQLHHLIQTKLLRTDNGGSSRARRRAWRRNKLKVQRLRSAIMESRQNLLTALSTNSSSFASQAHASLSLISRKVDLSCKSSSAIEEKLDAVLAATFTIQNQTDIVKYLLPFLSRDGGHYPLLQVREATTSLETMPPRFLDTNLHNIRRLEHDESIQKDRPESSCPNEGIRNCSTATQTTPERYQTPSPFGLLENSPNFALESYTLMDFLPYHKLQTFDACEEQSNEFFRINSYSAFFFVNSSRRWRRLFLAVVISRNSPYWNCLQVATVKVRAGQLPESLRKGVELFLSNIENVQNNLHLTIHLEGGTMLGYDAYPQNQIHPKQISVSYYSQDILRSFDDLGCPRYYEDQLVRLTGAGGWAQCATYINGRLLLEFKFTTLLPTADEVYSIQVLHCLNGNPRIASFAGIIVDSKGRNLTGYLLDDLNGDSIGALVHRSLAEGNIISWAQRERWGRQIVEGVSHVHSKGFVVGMLASGGRYKPPFRINGITNEAMLFNFRNKLDKNERGKGFMPPEYRLVTEVPGYRETVDVTPRTDIFHLGMILWLLAENKGILRKENFCEKVGCYASGCREVHADPISLPELADDIPQYWKDIVVACRRPDPNHRPPAWKILQSFPSDPTSELEPMHTQSAIENVEDLGAFVRVLDVGVMCDACGAATSEHAFHCDTCISGDFDLCPFCFNQKNKHCYNQDHFLVERKPGRGTQVQTEIFYSSVGLNGREVKIL